MSDRTESLLRDAFAAHEHLADPDVAHEIVRSVQPRTRRWPAYVAVAAALLMVAVVGGVLAGHDASAPAPPSSDPTHAASTPATRTYADNRAFALAEAKRVIRSVPLPDGAAGAELTDWPKSGFGMAPADPGLRQVRIWSVPTDADTVEQYLRDHDLEGSRPGYESRGSSYGGPLITSLEYVVPSPDDDAMIDTTVMVQWLPEGDHTLVRADTFTAARSVRTTESLVPDDVISLDVLSGDPPGRMPRGTTDAHLTAPQDDSAIDALARAVNDLPGSIRPVQVVSCPAMTRQPPDTTLRFRTTTGVLTFHLVDFCLEQVEVRRDGVRLHETLDPGDLTDTVDRLIS